jgi:CheY-like chemotaxis protein
MLSRRLAKLSYVVMRAQMAPKQSTRLAPKMDLIIMDVCMRMDGIEAMKKQSRPEDRAHLLPCGAQRGRRKARPLR